MELREQMEKQVKAILAYQDRLRISLDRQEQKDMEHLMLEFNSNIAIYEREMDERKRQRDKNKKQDYKDIRATVKSDTAAYIELEKKHEQLFYQIMEMEDNLKHFNRNQKWFIRFADKIDGWFIQQNVDNKRMELLENL